MHGIVKRVLGHLTHLVSHTKALAQLVTFLAIPWSTSLFNILTKLE